MEESFGYTPTTRQDGHKLVHEEQNKVCYAGGHDPLCVTAVYYCCKVAVLCKLIVSGRSDPKCKWHIDPVGSIPRHCNNN